MDTLSRRLADAATRLGDFMVSHWLLVANGMLFLFIAPPFLAPFLEAAGLYLPAKIIYVLYRVTCHQLPERSFFLSGHQVAFCARCSAIYLSFWAVGLLYGLWRLLSLSGHYPLPPLSEKVLLLLAVPILLDGSTQLVGLRTSTNLLRAITGTLAGGGAGLFVYPLLERGFADSREQGRHPRPTVSNVERRAPTEASDPHPYPCVPGDASPLRVKME